jgi:hypothetical protein
MTELPGPITLMPVSLKVFWYETSPALGVRRFTLELGRTAAHRA